MYVYLLQCGNKTYVGATVNLERRLRQHNRELTGGAKYTGQGKWTRIGHVSGFPTWKEALKFEWKWKQLSRKVPSKNSLQRRLEALNLLIASGKSTTTSIPFDDWIQVHEG